MKYLIVLFLLTAYLTEKPPSNRCSLIKNGKFKIDSQLNDSTLTTTFIERIDNVQYETNDQFGVEYRFRVVWISECTYQLKWEKTIRDDNNFNYPENEILTVEIIEVHEKFYTQVTTSSLHDFEYRSKVMIID
jgi:hypothetical protein